MRSPSRCACASTGPHIETLPSHDFLNTSQRFVLHVVPFHHVVGENATSSSWLCKLGYKMRLGKNGQRPKKHQTVLRMVNICPRLYSGRNPLLEQMKPMPPASYFKGARRVAREATFDPLRGAFVVLARPNDPEPNPPERRRGLGGSPSKELGQVKALLVRPCRGAHLHLPACTYE